MCCPGKDNKDPKRRLSWLKLVSDKFSKLSVVFGTPPVGAKQPKSHARACRPIDLSLSGDFACQRQLQIPRAKKCWPSGFICSSLCFFAANKNTKDKADTTTNDNDANNSSSKSVGEEA